MQRGSEVEQGSEPVDGPQSEVTSGAWAVPQGVRTASDWSWRFLVIAAAAAVVIWGLQAIAEVTIPVVVALLLAALLKPLARRLERRLPRGASVGLTVLGTLAVVLSMLSFVGSQFVAQLADISAQVGQGIDQVRQWVRDTLHISDSQMDQWIVKARDQISQSGSNLGASAAHAGITVTHVVAGFFIAMFVLFFFLLEGERIWAWIVGLFPSATRQRVHSSGLIAWGQLSAFTRATMLVAAADATGIGLGAAILHVPFASGIAVLVFFGAFVPIVGALVSGMVAILLALVALGPIQALIMLGIVIAVQQVESHVLQPFLLGRAVAVHPLAVILAIAAGVVLAGIVGALIAVPLVAVANAVGKHLLISPAPDETLADLPAPTQDNPAEA